MKTKLTDQMERDWMEREILGQSMERIDVGVLLGTCAAIAVFVGIVLSAAG